MNVWLPTILFFAGVIVGGFTALRASWKAIESENLQLQGKWSNVINTNIHLERVRERPGRVKLILAPDSTRRFPMPDPVELEFSEHVLPQLVQHVVEVMGESR